LDACHNRRAFARHHGGCGRRADRGRVVDAVVCRRAKSSAPDAADAALPLRVCSTGVPR